MLQLLHFKVNLAELVVNRLDLVILVQERLSQLFIEQITAFVDTEAVAASSSLLGRLALLRRNQQVQLLFGFFLSLFRCFGLLSGLAFLFRCLLLGFSLFFAQLRLRFRFLVRELLRFRARSLDLEFHDVRVVAQCPLALI